MATELSRSAKLDSNERDDPGPIFGPVRLAGKAAGHVSSVFGKPPLYVPHLDWAGQARRSEPQAGRLALNARRPRVARGQAALDPRSALGQFAKSEAKVGRDREAARKSREAVQVVAARASQALTDRQLKGVAMLRDRDAIGPRQRKVRVTPEMLAAAGFSKKEIAAWLSL